jgi:hypothetical protein
VWWYRPIIPALKRLRQEDLEFQFSLHYLVGRCLKKKKKILLKMEEKQL